MTRPLPPRFVEAIEEFSSRASLTSMQRDALEVIVKCAWDGGVAQGRVDGAEAIVELSRPSVVAGGAA